MISQSDRYLIEKLIDVRNRGLYANGRDVTLAYNRVFGANLSPTNCSSCIRTRINLLEKQLRKEELEEQKALEEQMKEAQVAENKDENGKEEDNGSKRKSSKREKSRAEKNAD